jgi:hypothetical protein
MKLLDCLKALANNVNLSVTLINKNEETLVTFNAAGYLSIEDSLQELEVVKIKLVSSKEVTLILGDQVSP